jgi:hypothetical protein
MSRVIPGKPLDPSKFFPMIGIGRKIGQFVKGKVTETGVTKNKNVVVTLELIDMDGTTSIQAAKGVYQEVNVNQGDKLQLVANLTDLRDKLPDVQVGDVLTVTYKEDVPSGKGKPKKIFEVMVD